MAATYGIFLILRQSSLSFVATIHILRGVSQPVALPVCIRRAATLPTCAS